MWLKSTPKHKILLSHFMPTQPYPTLTLYFQNLSISEILNWSKVSLTFTQLRTQLRSILSLISCIKKNAHKSWSIHWAVWFQETVKHWLKYHSFQEEKWLTLLKYILKCSNLTLNPSLYKLLGLVRKNKWPKHPKGLSHQSWFLWRKNKMIHPNHRKLLTEWIKRKLSWMIKLVKK